MPSLALGAGRPKILSSKTFLPFRSPYLSMNLNNVYILSAVGSFSLVFTAILHLIPDMLSLSSLIAHCLKYAPRGRELLGQPGVSHNYELNCVPPNSYSEALTPTVTMSRGRTFKEMIKVK